MTPDLGKYAAEVISAYLVTIGLIALLVLVSLRQAVRTRNALRDVERARQERAQADAAPDREKKVAKDG